MIVDQQLVAAYPRSGHQHDEGNVIRFDGGHGRDHPALTVADQANLF